MKMFAIILLCFGFVKCDVDYDYYNDYDYNDYTKVTNPKFQANRIYFYPKGAFPVGPIPGFQHASTGYGNIRNAGGHYTLCPGSSSFACNSQGNRLKLYRSWYPKPPSNFKLKNRYVMKYPQKILC